MNDKKLRIAFCGPNVRLNQELVDFVKNDLLFGFQLDPVIIQNPVAEILDFLKMKQDELSSTMEYMDWVNLWSVNWRNLKEVRHRKEACVLSPSCGIDQLAVQAAWFADQTLMTKTLSLPNSYADMDVAGLNKTGSVLQVILNQTEQEVADWWTHVYAVLPVSSKLSITPSEVITQYDDFLTSAPAFDAVQRIPDNPTSAKDFLREEVDEWKSHLGLS